MHRLGWFGKRKAKRKGRARRQAGIRWGRWAAVAFVVLTFGSGFYLAQLYLDISALIVERQAALTSAIYSAPTVIRAGGDTARLHLLDRLARLSYTETPRPTAPGEFEAGPRAMLIYTRGFREGAAEYPAQLVRVTLRGTRVEGVADSFGVALKGAELQPEVIGRLLPGTPAERVEVALGELPPFLVKGLLATEDRWFYYHPGFDPIRIVKAAVNDLRTHRLAQGASTITQQLARTFLDRHERTFTRKIKELAVAIVLEIRLSKNEILERYINDVPMGEYDGTPIEGLPLAARYLFNKDLSEVTPAQAATLIGMIRAPTMYDPRRHPEAARRRRDTVLAVMRRAGVIDRAAFMTALAAPVTVANVPGLRRAPYFTDYVTAFVRSIPGIEDRLRGLKVYTTLDPELQAEARASVEYNLARLERGHRRLRRRNPARRLQSAMVAMAADSGAILAMVGGRDYAQSQFNRVTMAERQPGSAFKPIVYLTALDPSRSPLGRPLTLASTLPDRPMSFHGWMPANYERTYRGRVTVAQALYDSLNVPTAYLGSLLGPPAMIRTAHELGIHGHLAAVLPMAIGADETTLLQLTSVYQVFADHGVKSPPYAVESVVDAHGDLIYSHAPDRRQVVDPNVAYLITGALKAVINYGTGASARRLGLDFPAAGKTGTTQDYKDAYFIGYTPEVVCGVWVGFDEPHSIGLSGAQAALPAWVSFMTGAAPNVGDDFAEPSGVRMVAIDPSSGGLAAPGCPRVIALPFLLGTAPRVSCMPHGGVIASAPPAAPPPPAPISSPPPKAPTTAASSSSVFGFIGKFIGSLFGH